MILENIPVTVEEETDAHVIVRTESGDRIAIDQKLVPTITTGAKFYIAADVKPMVSSEQHAKDVLNEIIKK